MVNLIGPAVVPAAQLVMEGANFLSKKLEQSPSTPKSANLDKVADDLESVFLSLVLKEMRQTLDGESLFGKDQGDVHGGMFDLFMAQHLSQGEGIGLARMIKQQLAGPKDNGSV